jgi:WD40 repeat protein
LATLRTPSHVLSGHTAVVIAADWLPGKSWFWGSKSLRIVNRTYFGIFSIFFLFSNPTGGEQLITASWDRTASLWDVQTGERLQNFTGHDQELTFATSHPIQKLFVTCGKDSTFRMWDLRSNCHSVSVFQGHTE